MGSKFIIPYGRQDISREDINEVVEVLKSDFLTQGPRIQEFEDSFARAIGSKYAVAVANGTAALHLSAMSLNVSAKDTYITTPITFAASANCIKYCGGNIDFVDIDRKTYVLDLNQLEEKLKSNPNKYSGVIPVDFSGLPVNLEELKILSNKYGLNVIEDACHAPGAYFLDKQNQKQYSGNCTFTDLAIFSFHPVKHIAAGEGGMITTNDENLYRRLLTLRSHGITKNESDLLENHGGWYYEMQELGYNYRITDIQAALGNSQLKRLKNNLLLRTQIADKYRDAFNNHPAINLQEVSENALHAYHLFIIEVENRKELYNHLRSKNIFPQIHYVPVHLHPYYKDFGWKKGDFPHAEDYYSHCLSLPMYPTLSKQEQDFVIQTILEFFENK